MKLSSVVSDFAGAIQDNIRATGHKIHWRNRSLPYLRKKFFEKVEKLREVDNPYEAASLCVVGGKLLMMIRDKELNPDLKEGPE